MFHKSVGNASKLPVGLFKYTGSVPLSVLMKIRKVNNKECAK